MAYQVIARKWRPQSFDAVVFQDHVSNVLRNSIKSGRIAHAYLFSGPRGVGKTTTARILAKALNCVNGPTAEPCGVCEHCVEIRDGNSFDVIEIDAASNRGIDNIRDLRERVMFAPVKTRYKVYIIDEMHMLSREAFNALLKTLEEPPAHVVFVLATTEYHKIPETILSRCQKFFFKRISVESVASHLAYIAKQEDRAITEGALFAIARAAEGSMRDAQTLLEQVFSFSEGDIDEHSALSILGVMPFQSFVRIMDAVARHDAVALLQASGEVFEKGFDPLRYGSGLCSILHVLRCMRSGLDVSGVFGYSPQEIEELSKLAARCSNEQLSAMFRVVTRMVQELRFSENERACFEMALLDLVAIHQRPSLAATIKSINSTNQPDSDEKKNVIFEDNSETPPRKNTVKTGDLSDAWQLVMRDCQRLKQYLFRKLQGAAVSIVADQIKIEYRGAIQDIAGLLPDDKDMSYLNERLGNLFDGVAKIVLVEKIENDAPLPDEAPPSGADVLQAEEDELETMHPVVQQLCEIFYGQIVEKENDNA